MHKPNQKPNASSQYEVGSLDRIFALVDAPAAPALAPAPVGSSVDGLLALFSDRPPAPEAVAISVPAPAPTPAPAPGKLPVERAEGGWRRVGGEWCVSVTLFDSRGRVVPHDRAEERPGEGDWVTVVKRDGTRKRVKLGAEVRPGVFANACTKAKPKPKRQCPGNNNCRLRGWAKGPNCTPGN